MPLSYPSTTQPTYNDIAQCQSMESMTSNPNSVMAALEALVQKRPLTQGLFTQQLKVFLDIVLTRHVAALTSRRSGKTTAILSSVMDICDRNPYALVPYCAVSDESVMHIVKPIVMSRLHLCKNKAKFTGNELRFSNGSTIVFAGVVNSKHHEKFRGQKLRAFVLDEAGSFDKDTLDYLLDEVIGLGLSDYLGPMILAGTPAYHCSGTFYEATTGSQAKWNVTKWTAFDNPYQAYQHKIMAEEYLQRKRVDESDPGFRREYLGEWCTDSNDLMIRPITFESPTVFNTTDWRCVVGVDFGFKDMTSFAVIGWRRDNPKAYLLKAYGQRGMTVTDIELELKRIRSQFSPIKFVADSAGGSKIIVEEFRLKRGLNVVAADKSQKAHYIEIMNDAIVNEKFVCHPTEAQPFVMEAKKLVWDEKRVREREGQDCDHVDAALYAFRESLHHRSRIPEPVTPEAEEEMMFKKVKERYARLNQQQRGYY